MAQVRLLDIDTVKDIFDSRMIHDFPPSELRPRESIEMLTADGNYFSLGYFDEDENLMAYALFARSSGSSFAMLDYFAVACEARGTGIGSDFLSKFREILTPEGIETVILEVECLETAFDDDDLSLRKRRIAFYENAGCKMSHVHSLLFSVHYNIMYMSATVLSDEDIKVELERIYRVIVPPLVKSEDEYQLRAQVSIK